MANRRINSYGGQLWTFEIHYAEIMLSEKV